MNSVNSMNRWVLFGLIMCCAGCASVQEKYIKSHPDLAVEQRDAIHDKMIVKGLNKEQVSVVLGRPRKTYAYQTEKNFVELWIYSEFYWHEYENILFQDGKVIAWNTPEELKSRLDKEFIGQSGA